MALVTNSAGASHIGKVRSDNQDSGYFGHSLFAVADGMGGHAGGDVASSVAINKLQEIDTEYESAIEAELALREAISLSNTLLTETVAAHPELTGMGTTLSAFIQVGQNVAIAHIGDSRIYRYREGKLSQITNDHTFVQRLVDNGRITLEEAKTHPRRSVLMRVLGDVDSTPDIDLQIIETRPGDRWLLCSDGLSSVIDNDRLALVLKNNESPQGAVDALIKNSLDKGAPDNVTVIIVDIHESFRSSPSITETLGAAKNPVNFTSAPKKNSRIPALRLPARTAASAKASHFERKANTYFNELVEENQRRNKRRKISWIIGVIVVVFLIVMGLFAGYQWTQTRYFIGESNGHVTIYQGVQQTIGPISLSHVYQQSTLPVTSLPEYTRAQVQKTISTDSVRAAEEILNRLTEVSTKSDE